MTVTKPPAQPAPSKEQLEAKVRHFANTVFLISSGVLMVVANLLQPLAAQFIGAEAGSQVVFIGTTILILVLASKRGEFALLALKRQCAEYGHVLTDAAPMCDRCRQVVRESDS